MKHLSTEEMIKFVNLSELTKENLMLAKKVNAHIVRCRECAEKVLAFQEITDAFEHAELNGADEMEGSEQS